MKSGLGAIAVVLLVACPLAAAATKPSTHPYVKIALEATYTPAQRLAIARRLNRNPRVRAVELLTRATQLSTARSLYKSLLPPDDFSTAMSALQQRTKNDILCVRVSGNAAADRLFASYDVKQRGVVSISKFSGGEMLSDCNLVNGLEQTRKSVPIAPADQN